MKYILPLLALILLFLGTDVCRAEVPHQVAGFVLGSDISRYTDKLNMQSALPLRFRPYLKEVETRNLPGFKIGLITYGTCAAPNHIVRIRLKYENASKKFFELLLKRFKRRFGPDPEWRGDPFEVIIAWKWSFVDAQKNRISLILQHNTMNKNEKMGNVVKLTMWNRIEAERACWDKTHPEHRLAPKEAESMPWGPRFWQHCIPR